MNNKKIQVELIEFLFSNEYLYVDGMEVYNNLKKKVGDKIGKHMIKDTIISNFNSNDLSFNNSINIIYEIEVMSNKNIIINNILFK